MCRIVDNAIGWTKYKDSWPSQRGLIMCTLSFTRQEEESCPIRCTSFSSEWENTVLQCAFNLDNASAAAATWHLKHHMPKVNIILPVSNKMR